MTKNEDILNPFEDTERKTLAVQNIVDKNEYLTVLFVSQHYTHLDTCPKFRPYYICVFHVGPIYVDYVGVRRNKSVFVIAKNHYLAQCMLNWVF